LTAWHALHELADSSLFPLSIALPIIRIRFLPDSIPTIIYWGKTKGSIVSSYSSVPTSHFFALEQVPLIGSTNANSQTPPAPKLGCSHNIK
jgi:hypothetical protein